MEKNVKMKDIKELGEQLGELQRVCREKKIPVMIDPGNRSKRL